MMSISQKFSIESLVSGSNQLSSSLSSNTSTRSFSSALSTSPDPASSFAQFSNFLRVSPLSSLSMLANSNSVTNNGSCYQDNSSSVFEEVFEARGRKRSSASPALSDDNGAADADSNVLLSGYTSCGSSTAGADEMFGCDGMKPNRDERPPIRQTLSYLDVIFPHIQMICANMDSAPLSQQRQAPVTVTGDEMEQDEITSASAPTGERKMTKEWLELVKHSFFNFPGKNADSQENGGPAAGGSTPGQMGGAFFFQQMQKSKRNRTAFSTQQLDQLERAFGSNHYVIGNERKSLAECLNLSETQVKVWFQNRRTKQKRVETVPRS